MSTGKDKSKCAKVSQEPCWYVGWLALDQASQPAAPGSPRSLRVARASAATRSNAVDIDPVMIAPAANIIRRQRLTLLHCLCFAEIFNTALRKEDRTPVPFNCRTQGFARGLPTSIRGEFARPWIAAFSCRRSCCSANSSDVEPARLSRCGQMIPFQQTGE